VDASLMPQNDIFSLWCGYDIRSDLILYP